MDKDTDVFMLGNSCFIDAKLIFYYVCQMMFLIIIFFIIAAPIHASDHCMLYPVSLEERVHSSDVIVEAEVEKDSVFATTDMIYTAFTLRIIGTLKGMDEERITMLIEGGMLPDRGLIVSPSLKPELGKRGIFLLKKSGNYHIPFAGPQSMIAVQEDGRAHEPFRIYPSLLDAIERIVAMTGIPYRHQPIKQYIEKSEKTLAASISGISPTTSTAGRGSILTITGSGFGGSRSGNAKVEFRNGNDGGASWTAPASAQYVSWSDNQIQVRIPSLAGTGQVRVTATDNSTAISSQTLTIDYSLINTSLNRIWLTNQNSIGGHTWTFNNAFGNEPTLAFKRALQNWRCNTFVNFGVSANTTSINQASKDAVNVISFNASLPSGALGVTYNWYAACAANQYYNDEFDMIFAPSPGAGWNYGPGPTSGGSFDFETVALHELGHAVQLGHVINTAIVMHYALGPNTDKRTLNGISDIAGGNDVVTFSTATKPCGPDEMIALNANNCTLFAPPIASFTAAPILGCAPLEVQFTDQSQHNPTTFAWDIDNNGTTDYTTASPQHLYTQPGTYSVKLTVSSGSGTNSVTMTNMITVLQKPAADGRGAFTACHGSQQVLGPANPITGGLPPYTYSWSPSIGLSNAFIVNPTLPIDFTNQRIYALTITDQRGCSIVVRDTVNPNPALTVSAGADRTECKGALVTLGGQPTVVGGTPPYIYAWSPTTGLNSSVIANPTIVIQQNQIFTVTVTDAKGCIKQDTVFISVHPELTITAGNDKSICINARDTIGGNPSARGGIPPYEYQWIPSTGLSSANIANPVVISPQTRSYILQVTDAFGCVKRDTVQITAILTDKPTIRIVSGKQTLCDGDSIVLEALGNFTGYRWKDGSMKKTITIRKADTVFVEATSASGCITKSDSLIIRKVEKPDMTIVGLLEVCANELITLRASSIPQSTLIWGVINGEIIGVNNRDSVVIRMEKSGRIMLQRTVGSCVYSKSDSIMVIPPLNPRILVDGNKESCEGDTVYLSFDGNIRSYTWRDGSNGRKMLLESGEYWADVEDNRGCISRSDTVLIRFNTPPVKPTISVSGDTLYATTATAYQWYSGEVEIPDARMQWYAPDTSGTYSVRVWNAEECSEISDPYSFFKVTGLPRVEQQVSKILGHPIDKELRIQHPYQSPSITIVNMLGITIYKDIAQSPLHVMSVELLPHGYYSLIIGDEILPILILH
jgi:PKD repeat protein